MLSLIFHTVQSEQEILAESNLYCLPLETFEIKKGEWLVTRGEKHTNTMNELIYVFDNDSTKINYFSYCSWLSPQS